MTIGTICAKEIGVCAKPECLCLQALHGNLATYLRLRGENVFYANSLWKAFVVQAQARSV